MLSIIRVHMENDGIPRKKRPSARRLPQKALCNWRIVTYCSGRMRALARRYLRLLTATWLSFDSVSFRTGILQDTGDFFIGLVVERQH